jgi:outer membrane protease
MKKVLVTFVAAVFALSAFAAEESLNVNPATSAPVEAVKSVGAVKKGKRIRKSKKDRKSKKSRRAKRLRNVSESATDAS